MTVPELMPELDDAELDDDADAVVPAPIEGAASPGVTAGPRQDARGTSSWGLSVTVGEHPARFGVSESLVLWLVARAGELQRGVIDDVRGAVEALCAELMGLAGAGDDGPLQTLISLCTVGLVEALDGWLPEQVMARAWEQTRAGAPDEVRDALPAFLRLLEQVMDRQAPESATCDVRATVYAALAVWAGLLADRDHQAWDRLCSFAGASADGYIESVDGSSRLRLAL